MKTISILLMLAGTALAESIYVAQETSGTGDGKSAENARSVAWFNTRSSWRVDIGTDERIGPGDRVYFVGPVTGAIVQADGWAEMPITIIRSEGETEEIDENEHTYIIIE